MAEPLVGRTLAGRYRLERAIGEGGMGAVYAATDLKLGRRVAVKVLLFEHDAKMLARFEQEALATAKLSSPNIVAVTEFRAEPEEPPFLVMELLDGEPLRERMKRSPQMPIATAVRISMQLLGALAVAHAAGIVHRDVKPTNVFLVKATGTGDEIVKLLDFGIAKVERDIAKLQTTAGTVLGTPSYFAPEQLLGAALDGRTDVHAVGIVLYEMLAGRRPWEEKNAVDLTAAILHAAPPPLDELRPDVPKVLTAAIADALAKERSLRPTAEELIARIAPFASEGPLAPVPLPRREAMSRPLPPWLIAGAVSVLAAASIVVPAMTKEPPAVVTMFDASADTPAVDAGSERPFDAAVDAPLDADRQADDDDDARRTRLYRARVAGLRGEVTEVRRVLGPYVLDGGATDEEARLLREACKAMKDRACSDAVRAMYPSDASGDPRGDAGGGVVDELY